MNIFINKTPSVIKLQKGWVKILVKISPLKLFNQRLANTMSFTHKGYENSVWFYNISKLHNK